MLIAYGAAIFISAFLLFFIQPMFAHMVLPLLGGTPQVWNTALVFYQAVLLAGYLYAHLSTSRMDLRFHVPLHLGVMMMALFFLPVTIPAGWSPPAGHNPTPWLLALFAAGVGLPFFVVATSSPLLQRWFSLSGHPSSSDPYFLYAAGNLGSILGVVAYPALAEPLLRVRDQAHLWTAAYGVLVAVTGICALLVWRSRLSLSSSRSPGAQVSPPETAQSGVLSLPVGFDRKAFHMPAAVPVFPRPSLAQRLRWIALAFVPCSLMLSVTTYMATDIASVPMLWIIPLGIYLLTFVLAFARVPIVPHRVVVKLTPMILVPLVVALAERGTDPIAAVIPLHLIAFFLIAMVCHGELVRTRPPVAHLTDFYLCMSIGGVLGGSFNALLAPLVFSSVAEYPIVVALSCLFLPAGKDQDQPLKVKLPDIVAPLLLGLATVLLVIEVQELRIGPRPLAVAIMFGIPAVISFSFSRRPLRFALAVAGIFLAGSFYSGSLGRVVHAERSFFGVSRVTNDDQGRFNQLMHGTTLHGSQALEPASSREALAYYYRTGPLGQFFAAFNSKERLHRVAVVGLGAGVTASYAQAGQEWTYYEIDPAIERIARDERYFTYLKDCRARFQVVLGDGRLRLAAAPDGAYDALILDAYSSDSMPVHLLTREALQLYFKKVAAHGVVLFHISNRYLDLEPVLGNLASDANLVGMAQSDTDISEMESEQGKLAAHYVIMFRTRDDLGTLGNDPRWQPLRTQPRLGVWTDDYSNIISILRWKG